MICGNLLFSNSEVANKKNGETKEIILSKFYGHFFI